jgi:hypothetical protein
VSADRLRPKWLEGLPARLRTRGVLIGLILAAGLALRTYGYLRNPSVWHDEAALVLNVLGKDFTGLLGPLFFAEAAPPLFLWVERVAVLILGDSTFALRLLPFLASCAALPLFLWVARRLLRPAAVPWALLLFSFNDHLLWHASEAKPYSFDVLAATVLLAMWLGTRRWPLTRQLLLYTAAAPVLIFLVYPGCFLLGGLLLALLPSVWRQRPRLGPWLAYSGLVLSVGMAFVLMYLGPARAQRNIAIEACWVDAFPPWDGDWWAVPVWMVKGTLDALCYCCAPAGNVLIGILIVGAVSLWQCGERSILVLMLVPAGLALAASFLGGYPYCGGRLLVYLTPAVVLLMAAGLPPSLTWLRARTRWAPALAAALVVAIVGTVAHNTVFPSGRADNAAASRYVLAQWRPGDVVWGSSWEHQYYFRHLGATFVPAGSHPTLNSVSRLWLVIIAATPEERAADLRRMTPMGWQPAERRDLYRTTVLLLQPPWSAGAPTDTKE